MIQVFRKIVDRVRNYRKDSSKQLFKVDYTIESQGEIIGRFTFNIRGHSKDHARTTAKQVKFKVDTIQKIRNAKK